MSERLEEIKTAPKNPASIEDFGIVKIYKEDFDWLIQQAERVEDAKEISNTIFKRNQELKRENDRCKQALGEMRLHAHYPKIIKQIYDEALAGEPNET